MRVVKVLVTGAAGRLGLQVVERCVGEGVSVRAFDLPGVDWEPLEALGVEKAQGDIADPQAVREAAKGVEAVVHLAAILPPKSEADRGLVERVNVGGTRNLLEAMGEEARMVFASSVATYGITAHEKPPIDEGHPQRAHDNYSWSKIEAEALVKASGKPYAILRVAPISVAQLLELPTPAPFRADQRVECVYVGDAAQAFLRSLFTEEDETLNIAGGPTWQLTGAEYLERFYGALGVEVAPQYPEEYTAVDWYDTGKSRSLGYQRTSFNRFEEKLRKVGEELGLR